jgi:hypothetical protein
MRMMGLRGLMRMMGLSRLMRMMGLSRLMRMRLRKMVRRKRRVVSSHLCICVVQLLYLLFRQHIMRRLSSSLLETHKKYHKDAFISEIIC